LEESGTGVVTAYNKAPFVGLDNFCVIFTEEVPTSSDVPTV
jgi:hypothetical protein